MDEKKIYVFDSFALLAYFEDEQGAEEVENILEDVKQETATVYLCVVNLGEVYYITCRERGRDKAEEVLATIDLLPIQQIDANRSLVLSAALIKAFHAISYADAFVAGLAQTTNGKIVTGDPEFQKLDGLVEILWLS
jgi:ribonuclease VapC